MQPNDLSAAVVTRQNLRAQLVAMYPELDTDDDADVLRDTLEGLDTLNEDIIAVLRAALEREAAAKAIDDDLIGRLVARSRRLKDGAKSLRAAVLQAMQEAGLPKVKAPDMTVSVVPGTSKIIVIDEAEIPDDLCRIRREPNKTEITKALAEGRSVPGVETGNSPPHIAIHRS